MTPLSRPSSKLSNWRDDVSDISRNLLALSSSPSTPTSLGLPSSPSKSTPSSLGLPSSPSKSTPCDVVELPFNGSQVANNDRTSNVSSKFNAHAVDVSQLTVMAVEAISKSDALLKEWRENKSLNKKNNTFLEASDDLTSTSKTRTEPLGDSNVNNLDSPLHNSHSLSQMALEALSKSDALLKEWRENVSSKRKHNISIRESISTSILKPAIKHSSSSNNNVKSSLWDSTSNNDAIEQSMCNSISISTPTTPNNNPIEPTLCTSISTSTTQMVMDALSKSDALLKEWRENVSSNSNHNTRLKASTLNHTIMPRPPSSQRIDSPPSEVNMMSFSTTQPIPRVSKGDGKLMSVSTMSEKIETSNSMIGSKSNDTSLDATQSQGMPRRKPSVTWKMDLTTPELTKTSSSTCTIKPPFSTDDDIADDYIQAIASSMKCNAKLNVRRGRVRKGSRKFDKKISKSTTSSSSNDATTPLPSHVETNAASLDNTQAMKSQVIANHTLKETMDKVSRVNSNGSTSPRKSTIPPIYNAMIGSYVNTTNKTFKPVKSQVISNHSHKEDKVSTINTNFSSNPRRATTPSMPKPIIGLNSNTRSTKTQAISNHTHKEAMENVSIVNPNGSTSPRRSTISSISNPIVASNENTRDIVINTKDMKSQIIPQNSPKKMMDKVSTVNPNSSIIQSPRRSTLPSLSSSMMSSSVHTSDVFSNTTQDHGHDVIVQDMKSQVLCNHTLKETIERVSLVTPDGSKSPRRSTSLPSISSSIISSDVQYTGDAFSNTAKDMESQIISHDSLKETMDKVSIVNPNGSTSPRRSTIPSTSSYKIGSSVHANDTFSNTSKDTKSQVVCHHTLKETIDKVSVLNPNGSTSPRRSTITSMPSSIIGSNVHTSDTYSKTTKDMKQQVISSNTLKETINKVSRVNINGSTCPRRSTIPSISSSKIGSNEMKSQVVPRLALKETINKLSTVNRNGSISPQRSTTPQRSTSPRRSTITSISNPIFRSNIHTNDAFFDNTKDMQAQEDSSHTHRDIKVSIDHTLKETMEKLSTIDQNGSTSPRRSTISSISNPIVGSNDMTSQVFSSEILKDMMSQVSIINSNTSKSPGGSTISSISNPIFGSNMNTSDTLCNNTKGTTRASKLDPRLVRWRRKLSKVIRKIDTNLPALTIANHTTNSLTMLNDGIPEKTLMDSLTKKETSMWDSLRWKANAPLNNTQVMELLSKADARLLEWRQKIHAISEKLDIGLLGYKFPEADYVDTSSNYTSDGYYTTDDDLSPRSF